MKGRVVRGIIVKGIAGFYYVRTDSGVFQCKARGIFKKDGVVPMVGDSVAIETLEGGDAVINSIDERKNEFVRPPVSNVDCFIVVIAAAKPEPNFRIVDRFLVMAESAGTQAVVCVNKIDIAKKEKTGDIEEIYGRIYPVVCVSALTGVGVNSLKELMKNGKYALAGPSGTGKSTLLNLLEPSAKVETGGISIKTSRGKHTTRHAEIFEIGEGAMVYDTPGFTSFEVAGASAEELPHLYPEMANLYGTCKYRNCAHIRETGCAVRDAVEAGNIHKSRYESYKEIYEEIIANREY